MYRPEPINIYRTKSGQRDIDSMEAEKSIEIIEIKNACTGDVCGVAWRPLPNKNDLGEDKE